MYINRRNLRILVAYLRGEGLGALDPPEPKEFYYIL